MQILLLINTDRLIDMKPVDMLRLNALFEKMVANRANIKEQRELSQLYSDFINEDRNGMANVILFLMEKRVG